MRQRYTTVKVPDRAHPLVKKLFKLMAEQRIGVLDMAARSGVNPNTLRDWRGRTVPNVANLDACLNVLGHSLAVEEVE